MNEEQQMKQEILEKAEQISNPKMHIPRAFRRKEEKRRKLWNEKFQKLAVNLSFDILNTNGVWDNPELQEKVNYWDNFWKVFVRDQFKKHSYLATTKEEREKYLHTFWHFAKSMCERQIANIGKKEEIKVSEDINDVEKILGVDISLNDLIQLVKKSGIKTKATTWKGLRRVIANYHEKEEGIKFAELIKSR